MPLLAMSRCTMPRVALAIPASAVLALALAGCGGSAPRALHRQIPAPPAHGSTMPASTGTTTTSPTTSKPTTTTAVPTSVATTQSSTSTSTTVAPTTSTSLASTFPLVIDQAMRNMAPLPAGIEAPAVLPATRSAVSAETTGLGGAYSVQLIATPIAEPVNSPSVGQAAANPGSDLGSFSTIAAASAAVAHAHLVQNSSQDLAVCSGPQNSLPLAGAASGRSCPTSQGEAITWTSGPWEYQVQEVGSATVPVAAARAVAQWVASDRLPSASSGLVYVSVPGTPEAGSSPSAVVAWQQGTDVYQVTTQTSYIAALVMAASMRPWPGAEVTGPTGTSR